MTRSSNRLPYDAATQRLLEVFPELANDYAKMMEWWQDEIPGSHIVFEELFCPFIDRVLASGDAQTRRRVFDFLEELATASDEMVQGLFKVTVYPYLRDDSARLRAATRGFGRASRKLAKAVDSWP
jgi:hypothetical protein